MKNFRTVLFVFAVTSFLVTHNVFAHPTSSPSAKAAARLKNHPPAGWINHYLGDDRYKIAGHVWQVVSTQSDRYFHRPDCPEMLRRSPDNVIGFASPADAVEAGYLPDPTCSPDADSSALSLGSSGGAVASHAVQVRLADGRSTVTLPAGWRKAQSQNLHQSMFSATIDVFTSSKFAKDGASVAVITVDYPSQIRTGVLTAARAREYMQMYNGSGYVDSALPAMGEVNLRDATFKGMNGILMTPRSKAHGEYSVYMLQKGSRLYIVGVGGKKGISAAAKGIINSYQPR